MTEYFKIIIPVVAAWITAVGGILKYFKDRTLNIYTENINNLFSEDKKVVLSTIATLDFFKNNKKYKGNVIDILVNRLYTELDYEIVNAIITELSQVSDVKEFKYVSQKFLDINRNFELQGEQISKRYEVLKNEKEKLLENYKLLSDTDKLKDEESKLVIHSKNITQKYKALSSYQLDWHKQIVGEALAMLLLEAGRKNITKDLEVTLFENNMSGTHLFNFDLKKLKILYAAFNNASLQELRVEMIQFEHAFFENTLIRRTNFSGGIISNVEFVNTKLDWVVFKNVKFEEIYFIGVEFNNCTFENVEGLDERLFFNCFWITKGNWINTQIDFEKTNNQRSEIEKFLAESNRSLWGRTYIKKKLEEQESNTVANNG